MNTMQALREKHNAVALQAREFVEANNSTWNADFQAKYDNYMNELDSIKNQADRLEAVLNKTSEDHVQSRVIESAEKLVKSKPENAYH